MIDRTLHPKGPAQWSSALEGSGGEEGGPEARGMAGRVAEVLARRAGAGGVPAPLSWGARASASGRGVPAAPGSPQVGTEFSREWAFRAEEVAAFVQLSGDANPLHQGPRAVVPGLLLGALFPGLVGTACPGAVYLSQSLSFRRPVQIGEQVTARVTVTRQSGSRIVFATALEAAGSGAGPGGGGVAVDGTALARIGRVGEGFVGTGPAAGEAGGGGGHDCGV